MLLAMYSVFKLFGVGEYQIEKLSILSHPPPRIRQISMMATVREYLEKRRGGEGLNFFDKIAGDAIIEVERSCCLVTGREIDMRRAKEATSQEARAHIAKNTEHWKDLYPELARLTRGDDLVKP